MALVTADPVVAAVRAEAAALGAIANELTAADLARPSPCPPWTVAGLLAHIVIALGRIGPAIDAASGPAIDTGSGPAIGTGSGEPAGPPGQLVTAAGYYRPGARFSAAANTDRIDVAVALAARLGTGKEISRELAAVCQRSLRLLAAAPADQEVRTRHGDRMLLSDFAVTRVVELAVHGLDASIALHRSPWLTGESAGVLEELLLPAGGPPAVAALRARLGCDRAGLLARLTGRARLSASESALLAELGLTRLALG
jgi:uncharacterized protein (TIGR03083 family)